MAQPEDCPSVPIRVPRTSAAGDPLLPIAITARCAGTSSVQILQQTCRPRWSMRIDAAALGLASLLREAGRSVALRVVPLAEVANAAAGMKGVLTVT